MPVRDVITLKYSGIVAAGDAVGISGPGEVSRGASGDPILGIVDTVYPNGYAAVAVTGDMAFRGVQSTLSGGGASLALNGDGSVRIADSFSASNTYMLTGEGTWVKLMANLPTPAI